MRLEEFQINPIDVNFHLPACLETSAESIFPRANKGYRVETRKCQSAIMYQFADKIILMSTT